MEKRSNEALVWPLFAAGGQLTALVTPVMILLTGILVPLGMFPEAMSYDKMITLLGNPFWALVLAVVLSLSAWHALYRLFRTLFDLGVRKALGLYAYVCFGAAGVITVVAFVMTGLIAFS
jgi:fumarate reductase subunit D